MWPGVRTPRSPAGSATPPATTGPRGRGGRRTPPAGPSPLSAAALPAAAQNLLSNGAFDQVGPLGPLVTFTSATPGGAGPSAAQDWNMFMNTPGTITSELVDSPLHPGAHMIRVKTTGDRNGIDQVYLPLNTGPDTVYACAWIYLVSGAVGIGTGH